jgi:hypothetical protein
MKILYWTPRIICILAIIFISMFAMDSFAPELTLWQQISGFLLHLIPSFILLLLLIVAWKWEYLGGILFAILGLGTIPLIFAHNYKINHQSVGMCLFAVLMINIPFVIVGVLFILNHFIKKKNITKTL